MADISTAKRVILKDADGNYVIPYTDKQDKLGYTPEDVANKASNLSNPSNTTYPTTKAVSDGLDDKADTDYVDTELGKKQNTLTAGANIVIDENNVISTTGVLTSVKWGGITGTLSNQKDLKTALDGKQGTLSEAQLNAANSGITSTKVSIYDGYATTLGNKADKSDTYTKSEVDAKVSSVYKVKGSVANYAALPKTGQTVGDVYNVLDTGANYVWTENGWDKLSETVDLSGYALKTDIPTKVSQLTNDSNFQTKQTTLSGYGITDAKIANGVITLGANTITPLTEHQDISGKADKSTTYTKTEVNTELGKKQNTISDLTTIRSGAALGATALQSIPSEYITETELSAYHDSSKQDKLTAGTNIKIENNTVSVTGDLGSKVTFRDWSIA